MLGGVCMFGGVCMYVGVDAPLGAYGRGTDVFSRYMFYVL